jgi:hypothetical protein
VAAGDGVFAGWDESATTYGKRMLPLLFTPELDDHDGVMFNSKGRAILPTRGFDTAYAERFLNASEELLRHALKADSVRRQNFVGSTHSRTTASFRHRGARKPGGVWCGLMAVKCCAFGDRGEGYRVVPVSCANRSGTRRWD